MNIYALINRYGQENDSEPFSPSEAALYFNLLYKANCRHWQMPIRCPTSKLSIEINVSRQAVHDACADKLTEIKRISEENNSNRVSMSSLDFWSKYICSSRLQWPSLSPSLQM
jgi:hypothetical protein